MNKIQTITLYLLMAVSAVQLTSCSSDEEVLAPTTDYNDNKFAVPDDATGPEAELRREFYSATGIYLLFTDLLERKLIGVDAYGDEVWKEDRVDFDYNLTSSGDGAPVMTEFDSYDQYKKAADFVKEYVYPHIEGSTLTPFSILLVNSIEKENYYGGFDQMNMFSCWRCTALAIDLDEIDAGNQEQYAVELLKAIVKDKFDIYGKDMDPFYTLSYEYAREYIIDYDPNWDRTDMTIVYQMGYLGYYKYGSNPARDYFYSSYGDNDFTDFYNAVMGVDESEFMAEYGDYPRLVEKYNIVKSCILKAGYKF